MTSRLREGDKVEWNTPQGKTSGRIEQKVTHTIKVAATELKGSNDDPVYLVKSDKSGKPAGHKANALTKRS